MTTAMQVVKSVLSLLIVYTLRGSLWCGVHMHGFIESEVKGVLHFEVKTVFQQEFVGCREGRRGDWGCSCP